MGEVPSAGWDEGVEGFGFIGDAALVLYSLVAVGRTLLFSRLLWFCCIILFRRSLFVVQPLHSTNVDLGEPRERNIYILSVRKEKIYNTAGMPDQVRHFFANLKQKFRG